MRVGVLQRTPRRDQRQPYLHSGGNSDRARPTTGRRTSRGQDDHNTRPGSAANPGRSHQLRSDEASAARVIVQRSRRHALRRTFEVGEVGYHPISFGQARGATDADPAHLEPSALASRRSSGPNHTWSRRGRRPEIAGRCAPRLVRGAVVPERCGRAASTGANAERELRSVPRGGGPATRPRRGQPPLARTPRARTRHHAPKELTPRLRRRWAYGRTHRLLDGGKAAARRQARSRTTRDRS